MPRLTARSVAAARWTNRQRTQIIRGLNDESEGRDRASHRGRSNGIGLAIAKTLTKAGAKVAITGRDEKRLAAMDDRGVHH